MDKKTVELLVKIYAVLAWIGGGLSIIGALAMMLGGAFFGALIPMGGVEGMLPAGMMGGLFIAMGIFLLAYGIFAIWVGVGLWKRQSWARIASIVLSALSVFSFPIGTLIGGFGIYLFGFDAEAKKLFK